MIEGLKFIPKNFKRNGNISLDDLMEDKVEEKVEKEIFDFNFINSKIKINKNCILPQVDGFGYSVGVNEKVYFVHLKVGSSGVYAPKFLIGLKSGIRYIKSEYLNLILTEYFPGVSNFNFKETENSGVFEVVPKGFIINETPVETLNGTILSNENLSTSIVDPIANNAGSISNNNETLKNLINKNEYQRYL